MREKGEKEGVVAMSEKDVGEGVMHALFNKRLVKPENNQARMANRNVCG